MICAVWCVYWFVHAWHYWEDDAYIHLEFARSVAAGKGFAFNGRVVAGDTSPLWVLLLAGVHVFVRDWLVDGKVLTVLGALFGFAGMYSFARRLSGPLVSDARIFPAVMVLLIAVNPYTCYWIFSGMEPIAAAGLACFAVLAATRKRGGAASFLAGCLMAGVAPLLRPEMIFLTGLLAMVLLMQGRRLRTPNAVWRYAAWLVGLILLAGPLTLWSLYSLHAFGHVMPNTNAAKRALPGDSVIVRLVSIYGVGFPIILCGLLGGLALLVMRFSSVRRSFGDALAIGSQADLRDDTERSILPLAGWIFVVWATIASVFYVFDHTYVQTRYILVSAPGLTIVVIYLFLRMSRRMGWTLCAAGYIAGIAVSMIATRPLIANKAEGRRLGDALALYVRNNLPSNAPVAAYSIGQLAFMSEHPIIDTGGITRPEAIPYGVESPDSIVQWARSEGAQYYISSWSPMPGSYAVYTAEYPSIGWTLEPSGYAKRNPVMIWKLPELRPSAGETKTPSAAGR
ncbi:MAG TPA: hypothetical protein VGU46_01975 [Acidobacteriaceae bacterium]|nr:hypothetical protein [Acidobacteriaceae bacterium]